MSSLYDSLINLSQSDIYPFHMPGHKRQMQGRKNESLYDIDITEISGFDNLHHPEGILKNLEDRAGNIFGGNRTWISVNGSTAGILSAISAVCQNCDTIILDRGSHKSAYNACALKKLNTVFAYPKIEYKGSVVRGGIVSTHIEELINKCIADNRTPKAVFVTSPTYDGVVSDIQSIAEICHKREIPLIVDEAHGAHFFLDDRFPQDALSLGADVVIHSIHKTLPAPTQTALVHLQGNLVKEQALDTYMGLYQTSSPSYVLMAAIEQCLDIIEAEGKKLCDGYFKNLESLYQRTEKLKNIDVLGYDSFRDQSKIIISPKKKCNKVSGADLGEKLRTKYHIEPEMVVPGYVCALSSVMDTEEGFDRLSDALLEIDKQIDSEKMVLTKKKIFPDGVVSSAGDFFIESDLNFDNEALKTGCVMDIDAAKCKCPLEKSVGHKSGGFVQLYPPGIPMLIPGEEITSKAVSLIRRYQECKLLVEGIDEEGIWILK